MPAPSAGGIGGIAIAGNTFADYDMTADGKRFVMFPRGAATGEERAGIVTIVSVLVRRSVARVRRAVTHHGAVR